MAEGQGDKPGGWSWSWSAKKPEVMKGTVEVIAGHHDAKSCPACGQKMPQINRNEQKQMKNVSEK